uniref:C2 domain-containing protein n=1 Tax=Rhinolophus ferrumequinum TaxID=59479 RepID=A0A671EY77_RHIFE
MEMYRVSDGHSEQLVYRTEVVKNNLSPTWEPFKVSLNYLCSCEETRPLKVETGRWGPGGHDFIGEFTTTFIEMKKAFREGQVRPGQNENHTCQAQWDCVSTKYKQKKRNYQNSGVAILVEVSSFLDYIMGGCQIHCTIGSWAALSTWRPKRPTQPVTRTVTWAMAPGGPPTLDTACWFGTRAVYRELGH